MVTSAGSLELCYDELNRPYRTPLFCITTPENISDPNCPPKTPLPGPLLKSCSQSTFCAQPISLKIRINPGDFNLRVVLSTADSILDLKMFIQEQSLMKVREIL
jgi:hypothetical protein